MGIHANAVLGPAERRRRTSTPHAFYIVVG